MSEGVRRVQRTYLLTLLSTVLILSGVVRVVALALIAWTSSFWMAIVLLVAGICLLKRARISRGLYMTYASVNMVLSVVGLVIVLTVVLPTLRQGEMPKAAATAGTIGAVVGVVIGMAWPLFLLVWFSRRKIRQEVQQW